MNSESGRTVPLYILFAAAVVFSLIFADRFHYLAALLAAICLWLAARSVGKALVLSHSESAHFFQFALGLGTLLTIAYAIFLFSARWQTIMLFWLFLPLAAIRELKTLKTSIPLKYLAGAPFFILALWSASTPSVFYDSLVYHLALPFRYLANGKMAVLPDQLYSTFPPFEQVLNLLFIGIRIDSGIKLFNFILYLEIIAAFANFLKTIAKASFSAQTETLVWIMFLFPAPWILIHIITADLLAGLFLCTGILGLARNMEEIESPIIIFPALTLGFCIWTKVNSLLYVSLLPVFFAGWYLLNRSKDAVRSFAVVTAILIIMALPLFLRNYITTGNPLYPVMHHFFSESSWTDRQNLALQLDSFSNRGNPLTAILLTPFKLTFNPNNFGSAAEIGILYIAGLLIYPFAIKNRIVNRILLYAASCYIGWVFIFYSFRQFFPIFLLCHLPCYFSFQWVRAKSRIVFSLLLLTGFIFSLSSLFPVFAKYFPLINPGSTRSAYLAAHLDYFNAAIKMNNLQSNSKILFLGETRSAYMTHPAIVSSTYDQNPFWRWVSESRTPQDLLKRFRSENAGFIFCNWEEYARLVEKVGVLPVEILPQRFASQLKLKGKTRTGLPVMRIGENEKILVKEFLAQYVRYQWRSGDHLFFYSVDISDAK